MEVVLRDVPAAARLSRGERRDESTWKVRAADLEDLHLTLNDGTPDAFDVRIDVLAPAGMAAASSVARVRLVGLAQRRTHGDRAGRGCTRCSGARRAGSACRYTTMVSTHSPSNAHATPAVRIDTPARAGESRACVSAGSHDRGRNRQAPGATGGTGGGTALAGGRQRPGCNCTRVGSPGLVEVARADVVAFHRRGRPLKSCALRQPACRLRAQVLLLGKSRGGRLASRSWRHRQFCRAVLPLVHGEPHAAGREGRARNRCGSGHRAGLRRPAGQRGRQDRALRCQRESRAAGRQGH